MRIRSVVRALVLGTLVLPLLVTGSPPASASTDTRAMLAGTMTLNAGISYPCSPATTQNTQKCPFPTPPKSAPWGNVRSFGMSSSACASESSDVAKAGVVASFGGGTCSFFATGTIKLDCIFGDGLGVATLQIAPVGGSVITKTFGFAIKHAHGVITLIGNGPDVVTGSFVAPPPLLSGNSCLDKTAVTITYGGGITITTLN